MSVSRAKTQISLGIRTILSESSMCAQWVTNDPNFLQVDNKDSDQTELMPRLIWVSQWVCAERRIGSDWATLYAVFTVCSMGNLRPILSSCGEQRLLSDWRLGWSEGAEPHCWCSHNAAYFFKEKSFLSFDKCSIAHQNYVFSWN